MTNRKGRAPLNDITTTAVRELAIRLAIEHIARQDEMTGDEPGYGEYVAFLADRIADELDEVADAMLTNIPTGRVLVGAESTTLHVRPLPAFPQWQRRALATK